LVCRLTTTTSSGATVAMAATTRFGFVNQIGSFFIGSEAGLDYDWLFFMFYSGVGFILVATAQS
jgi:hypothetical protein